MCVSRLRTKSQTKLSTAALRNFRTFFPAIFTAFRRLLLWGSARRYLLASPLCCHAAFISASTPGPTHQPCAPRGRLERDTNSAAMRWVYRIDGCVCAARVTKHFIYTKGCTQCIAAYSTTYEPSCTSCTTVYQVVPTRACTQCTVVHSVQQYVRSNTSWCERSAAVVVYLTSVFNSIFAYLRAGEPAAP